MKALLFILFLTNIWTFGIAQDTLTQKIKEAEISIKLPNNQWLLDEKIEKTGLVVYIFNRIAIIDSLGKNISPSISIVIESIDKNMDLVNFSILKRTKRPFEVEKVFNYETGLMNFKNAICYQGNYFDDESKHTIYVVHAIKNGKGIQIIFDATTSIFSKINDEFLVTLKSFSD
jgi:hypothetical protein